MTVLDLPYLPGSTRPDARLVVGAVAAFSIIVGIALGSVAVSAPRVPVPPADAGSEAGP